MRITCGFPSRLRIFCDLLLGCLLGVAQLGSHQLENGVGERDDVGAAVTATAKLSVDRLGENANPPRILRHRLPFV